jgi:hypothetical protein
VLVRAVVAVGRVELHFDAAALFGDGKALEVGDRRGGRIRNKKKKTNKLKR